MGCGGGERLVWWCRGVVQARCWVLKDRTPVTPLWLLSLTVVGGGVGGWGWVFRWLGPWCRGSYPFMVITLCVVGVGVW